MCLIFRVLKFTVDIVVAVLFVRIELLYRCIRYLVAWPRLSMVSIINTMDSSDSFGRIVTNILSSLSGKVNLQRMFHKGYYKKNECYAIHIMNQLSTKLCLHAFDFALFIPIFIFFQHFTVLILSIK